MPTWTQLRHPSSGLIRSLTALNRGQIEKLRPTFKPALKRHQSSSVVVAPDKGQPKTGAARTPRLNSEDLLILILIYFSVYPTPDLLGLLLAGQQSWLCKWLHGLTPVLETTLAEVKQLPVRAGRPEKAMGSINQLLKICPKLSFIIDGVERNVRGPKDSVKQKQGYSGQKKRHRIKNTVISNQNGGNILFVGKSHPGCSHHKKMANEEIPVFPAGRWLWPDTGYQGYLPAAVIMTYQPGKKLKNREGRAEDKSFNRQVSAIRVHVEHAIGGLKPSNIISDIYRHRRADFEDQVLPIAAG
jgi:hypothetical protein